VREVVREGNEKNSYIQGGCSDVGALTYYEKTTRSKINLYIFIACDIYATGCFDEALGGAAEAVARLAEVGAKKKSTPVGTGADELNIL
jgi:hypothetical protein